MYKRILAGLFGLFLALGHAQNIDTSRLRYTAPFTGAVQRLGNLRLGDFRTVKDFGAVGDGNTDDSGAFQSAVNSISAGGYGIVYCPDAASTYNLGSVISANGRNVLFVLAPGCRLSGSGSLPITNVYYDAFGLGTTGLLRAAQGAFGESSLHLAGAPWEAYTGTYFSADLYTFDIDVRVAPGAWSRGYRISSDNASPMSAVFGALGTGASVRAFWGTSSFTDQPHITGYTSPNIMMIDANGNVTFPTGTSGHVLNGSYTVYGALNAQSTVLFGTSAAGTAGTAQLIPNPGGSVSARLAFGTAGGGSQFRLGKNQGGIFTDYVQIDDAGNVQFDANTAATFQGSVKATNGFTFGDSTVQVSSAYAPFFATSSSGTYVASQANGKWQFIKASGGSTVQLPSASGFTSAVFIIKNTDGSTISITTTGGATVDGMTSGSITPIVRQYDALSVICDGTNWFIF